MKSLEFIVLIIYSFCLLFVAYYLLFSTHKILKTVKCLAFVEMPLWKKLLTQSCNSRKWDDWMSVAAVLLLCVICCRRRAVLTSSIAVLKACSVIWTRWSAFVLRVSREPDCPGSRCGQALVDPTVRHCSLFKDILHRHLNWINIFCHMNQFALSSPSMEGNVCLSLIY